MILRNQRRTRRGGVVVEMAVVSCICFAFMFAIFEYGRVVMVQQIMENAVRAGCRAAVVVPTSYTNPTTDTNNVIAVVNDQLANMPITLVNIQIYEADNSGNNIGPWTSSPFGQNIMVQIDADCPNLFPTGVPTGFQQSSPVVHLLPNSSTTTSNAVHLTAKAMMRGEAN